MLLVTKILAWTIVFLYCPIFVLWLYELGIDDGSAGTLREYQWDRPTIFFTTSILLWTVWIAWVRYNGSF